MDATQQELLAERLREGFEQAGIVIEEPMADGGNRRFVPCTNWVKVVAWLMRSGYRLSIRSIGEA